MRKKTATLLSWPAAYRQICALAILVLAFIYVPARAQDCPTGADPIATDRPDVTNSSLVVPTGSLQAENGIDLAVVHQGIEYA